MKRHSLTSIIGQVQILTIHAMGEKNFSHTTQRIRKAAVNEIIRLEADNIVDWQEFLTGQLKPVQP